MYTASMYDLYCILLFFFFFNDTATTEIYTLSLHDALPIYERPFAVFQAAYDARHLGGEDAEQFLDVADDHGAVGVKRSEEHTSELQSLRHLVCRLLLEKKKNKTIKHT